MEIIISGAIGIVTMVAGYFLGKKKQDADISATNASAHFSELDATEKAVAIWRALGQDLKREVDELRILVVQLRAETGRLKDEIEHLHEKLSKFINK